MSRRTLGRITPTLCNDLRLFYTIADERSTPARGFFPPPISVNHLPPAPPHKQVSQDTNTSPSLLSYEVGDCTTMTRIPPFEESLTGHRNGSSRVLLSVFCTASKGPYFVAPGMVMTTARVIPLAEFNTANIGCSTRPTFAE